MASWFYAIMRVFYHKDVLKAAFYTLKLRDFVKNDKPRGAVIDI